MSPAGWLDSKFACHFKEASGSYTTVEKTSSLEGELPLWNVFETINKLSWGEPVLARSSSKSGFLISCLHSAGKHQQWARAKAEIRNSNSCPLSLSACLASGVGCLSMQHLLIQSRGSPSGPCDRTDCSLFKLEVQGQAAAFPKSHSKSEAGLSL